MRPIRRIILHHSATPCSVSWNCARIRNIHIRENKWSDIGYHFVIEHNGRISLGRPLEKQGAHCKGYNYDSIGICIVGGIDKNGNVSPLAFKSCQFTTAASLIYTLCNIFGLDSDCIYLHRELASTACPAFELSSIYPDLINE